MALNRADQTWPADMTTCISEGDQIKDRLNTLKAWDRMIETWAAAVGAAETWDEMERRTR